MFMWLSLLFELYKCVCVTLRSRRGGWVKIKLARSSVILKVESLKLHVMHFRLLARCDKEWFTHSEQVRVWCFDTLTQHIAVGRAVLCCEFKPATFWLHDILSNIKAYFLSRMQCPEQQASLLSTAVDIARCNHTASSYTGHQSKWA